MQQIQDSCTGQKVVSLFGAHTHVNRQKAFDDFAEGKRAQIMVATDVLGRGVDVPAVCSTFFFYNRCIAVHVLSRRIVRCVIEFDVSSS
jgi:superfamily II DNA/RNA helicase